MAICGLLGVDFLARVQKGRKQMRDSGAATQKEEAPGIEHTNNRGKMFLSAIAVAYVFILIRCIYR